MNFTTETNNELIWLLSEARIALMGLVRAPSAVEKYQRERVERTALGLKIGLFRMKLIKGGTRRTPVTHQAKMSEDIGTFVLVAPLNW